LANEKPVLDLDLYANAIVKIVKDSEPKFTIGIYGEWGSGKTTLMKPVKQGLDIDPKKNVTTVWFNAWRYEREENYGITALLKTIAIELDKTGHYKKLQPFLLVQYDFEGCCQRIVFVLLASLYEEPTSFG
jgi:hypothetical protein